MQAQREGGGESCDRCPKNDLICMWCDVFGHIRRDCVDFIDALTNNNDSVLMKQSGTHVRDPETPQDEHQPKGNEKINGGSHDLEHRGYSLLDLGRNPGRRREGHRPRNDR